MSLFGRFKKKKDDQKKEEQKTSNKNVVPEKTEVSNSDGYYFENPLELAIYGKLFAKDKTVNWLSGDKYWVEFKKGYQLFDQGLYGMAVSVFRRCLELNPIGLSARFEICESYIKMGKLLDARKTLLDMKDFLVEEKSIARFYRRMGYIETERGNYKLAAACYIYSRAFENHPSIAQELKYIQSTSGFNPFTVNPLKVMADAGVPVIIKDSNKEDDADSVLAKLDKLYEEIEKIEPMMEFGYGNQEIIDAAKGTGCTPKQYREQLHRSYYQKQREYNKMIDQYQLSDKRKKIVIDSFTDNESMLSLLDPVEIDLKKRLASSQSFYRCFLSAENSVYRFYSCSYSMLREEKASGAVVFFGRKSGPSCVYHDKLYWYEWGSILSDKYLYRCNVEDGGNVEKLEWLSNEKTGEFVGSSYHLVSEDAVSEMEVDDDYLVLTVTRQTVKKGKYRIIAKDTGNSIFVSKHVLSGDFSACSDYFTFAKDNSI